MLNRSRLLFLGIVVLLLAAVVGCGSKWLAGGKLHFDQQRYERALENFQAAVEEQPKNPEAHLWLARALAELERDEDAVQALNLAQQHAAGLPEIEEQIDNTLSSYWSRRYNSGVDYAHKGELARGEGNEQAAVDQLRQALAQFERATLFCPDSVKNYSNMGKVLFQLGRRDEGRRMFDRARTMAGDQPELLDFLFRVYRSLGVQAMGEDTEEGYRDAIANFEQASGFEIAPEDNATLRFNIGVAQTELANMTEGDAARSHYQKAIAEYEKVLEILPEDESSLSNQAAVYSELGEHEKAIEIGSRMVFLKPWDHMNHFTMVRLYNAAGDRENSAAHLMLQDVLRTKEPVRGENIREHAGEFGPGSNILRALRDYGEPDQAFKYTGTRGTYDIWFYWTAGRVHIFQGGKEVFREEFRPLGADWEAVVMGQ
jgi:tetratricopeptide (TPR) repeat protein